ncbi:hypothetical protein, variant 1, partial [Sphaeroforma arctica JP610]
VVPPAGWVARRSYEGIKDLVKITSPIEQAMTGQQGVFQSLNIERKGMTIAKFEEMCAKDKFKPPTSRTDHEMERTFWKTVTYNAPFYGADIPGSLFDEDQEVWNLNHLDTILNLLDEMEHSILGVNSAYLYFGMWKTSFAWHKEDMDLYSINYLHYGAPKSWYIVPPASQGRLETLAKGYYPDAFRQCSEFLRHKSTLISPIAMKKGLVPFGRAVQRVGEFMITFPGGYHSGFNHGYNCAEATNFGSEMWVAIGMAAKACRCISDSVRIDMKPFVRKFHPELYIPTPSVFSSSSSSASEGSDTESKDVKARETPRRGRGRSRGRGRGVGRPTNQIRVKKATNKRSTNKKPKKAKAKVKAMIEDPVEVARRVLFAEECKINWHEARKVGIRSWVGGSEVGLEGAHNAEKSHTRKLTLRLSMPAKGGTVGDKVVHMQTKEDVHAEAGRNTLADAHTAGTDSQDENKHATVGEEAEHGSDNTRTDGASETAVHSEKEVASVAMVERTIPNDRIETQMFPSPCLTEEQTLSEGTHNMPMDDDRNTESDNEDTLSDNEPILSRARDELGARANKENIALNGRNAVLGHDQVAKVARRDYAWTSLQCAVCDGLSSPVVACPVTDGFKAPECKAKVKKARKKKVIAEQAVERITYNREGNTEIFPIRSASVHTQDEPEPTELFTNPDQITDTSDILSNDQSDPRDGLCSTPSSASRVEGQEEVVCIGVDSAIQNIVSTERTERDDSLVFARDGDENHRPAMAGEHPGVLVCANCAVATHTACCGLHSMPDTIRTNGWLCRRCDLIGSRSVSCGLCPRKGGLMMPSIYPRGWVHASCAMWISESRHIRVKAKSSTVSKRGSPFKPESPGIGNGVGLGEILQGVDVDSASPQAEGNAQKQIAMDSPSHFSTGLSTDSSVHTHGRTAAKQAEPRAYESRETQDTDTSACEDAHSCMDSPMSREISQWKQLETKEDTYRCIDNPMSREISQWAQLDTDQQIHAHAPLHSHVHNRPNTHAHTHKHHHKHAHKHSHTYNGTGNGGLEEIERTESLPNANGYDNARVLKMGLSGPKKLDAGSTEQLSPNCVDHVAQPHDDAVVMAIQSPKNFMSEGEAAVSEEGAESPKSHLAPEEPKTQPKTLKVVLSKPSKPSEAKVETLGTAFEVESGGEESEYDDNEQLKPPVGSRVLPLDCVWDLSRIPIERYRLKCRICAKADESRQKGKNNGACIQCYGGRCTIAVHVMCAQRNAQEAQNVLVDRTQYPDFRALAYYCNERHIPVHRKLVETVEKPPEHPDHLRANDRAYALFKDGFWYIATVIRSSEVTDVWIRFDNNHELMPPVRLNSTKLLTCTRDGEQIVPEEVKHADRVSAMYALPAKGYKRTRQSAQMGTCVRVERASRYHVVFDDTPSVQYKVAMEDIVSEESWLSGRRPAGAKLGDVQEVDYGGEKWKTHGLQSPVAVSATGRSKRRRRG